MAAALVSNASALVAARPVASRQSARSSGFVGPAPTRFTASRVAIKAKSVRVVTSAAADGVSAGGTDLIKKGVMSSFIWSSGSGLAFGVPREPKEGNHTVRKKGLEGQQMRL